MKRKKKKRKKSSQILKLILTSSRQDGGSSSKKNGILTYRLEPHRRKLYRGKSWAVKASPTSCELTFYPLVTSLLFPFLASQSWLYQYKRSRRTSLCYAVRTYSRPFDINDVCGLLSHRCGSGLHEWRSVSLSTSFRYYCFFHRNRNHTRPWLRNGLNKYEVSFPASLVLC